MPRKKLIRQNQFPYHVTSRSNNKEWFNAPLKEVWGFMLDSLILANSKTRVEFHCAVLMSNHYHLLISTPDSNLDKFMEQFNKNFSVLLKKRTGSINHKFANRYKWTIINSRSYLFNTYKYIYQNPVRARICKRCIDYMYSSVDSNKDLKINFDRHIEYSDYKEWIELVFESSVCSKIRIALKKNTFSLSKDTDLSTRKILENFN